MSREPSPQMIFIAHNMTAMPTAACNDGIYIIVLLFIDALAIYICTNQLPCEQVCVCVCVCVCVGVCVCVCVCVC